MSQINKPNTYFNTILWSGDNSTNKAITGVGFEPDLLWIKPRTEVHQLSLIDSVRGVNKILASNYTSAEDIDPIYGYISSFDNDGFTTQKGSNASQWNVNETGENYVSWNWRGSDSSAASNTDGSISSTVSANTTSGFSIVSYTGTGANATVGHGLGVAPSVVIVKSRSGVFNWGVYHSSIGNTKYLELNETTATQISSTFWQNTSPTSSVFSLGSNNTVNQSSGTYIAYCFAEKKGFSKFGSYTGNADNNGPFIYCGFSPALIITKRTDTLGDWFIYDNKRPSYNVVNQTLNPNTSDAEESTRVIDLLSNGFKQRAGYNDTNASGGTYIFMAFAENPLVGTNNIPATAR